MPAAPETTPGFYTLPHDAIEIDDTVRTTAGIALPATVTLSGQSAQPPIVVMVHGSGPLDRDETVLGNKTFLDLSCQLAEQGISTLRYDKRTMVYPLDAVSTMDDETILDALAAIRLARTYSNNVYLLGHSLGAMLAPAIAQRAGGLLSGIIMMAGPARDMEQVVSEQLDYLLPPDTPDSIRNSTFEQLRTSSPHYLQPQHQVEAALQLTLPMMILQGGRDYQVTMTEYNLWQQALRGHDNVVMRSYPLLNHLFLEGEGPSKPLEYQIQSHIPRQVIDDITAFINESHRQ
jgi:pimeloyl-ACP methyl ester carboxylesterase